MTLRDPETRKALRAIVGAIIALALITLVWFYAGRLTVEPLAQVLLVALSIVALRIGFDGAENVVNAVKLRVSPNGLEADVSAPHNGPDA